MGSPSPSSRSLATSFQTSYVDDIQDIDTSCAVEQHIISFVEDHTKTRGSQEIAINKYAKQMEKATALNRNGSFTLRSPTKQNTSYTGSVTSTISPYEVHQQVGKVLLRFGKELAEKREMVEKIESDSGWWKKGVDKWELDQAKTDCNRLQSFNDHYAEIIAKKEAELRLQEEQYEQEVSKYRKRAKQLESELQQNSIDLNAKLAAQTECDEESRAEKRRLHEMYIMSSRKAKFYNVLSKESEEKISVMESEREELELRLTKVQEERDMEMRLHQQELNLMKTTTQENTALEANFKTIEKELKDEVESERNEKNRWMRVNSESVQASSLEKQILQREIRLRQREIIHRERQIDWQKSELLYRHEDPNFRVENKDKVKQTIANVAEAAKRCGKMAIKQLVGPRKISVQRSKSTKRAITARPDQTAQITLASNFQTRTLQYSIDDLTSLQLNEISGKPKCDDINETLEDIFEGDLLVVVGKPAPRLCSIDEMLDNDDAGSTKEVPARPAETVWIKTMFIIIATSHMLLEISYLSYIPLRK